MAGRGGSRPNTGGAREGAGRPTKLKADEETLKQLEGLARIQCTEREAAFALGVVLTTFRKFLDDNPEAAEAFDRGKYTGRASLRRTQFKLAEKHPAMAIFLGKNYLGQTDKQEIEQTVTNIDLTKATDEEITAMLDIHEKIAQRRGGDGEE